MGGQLGMEQEKRVVRAFTEEMCWTLAPNGWVVNTASGGCYLVTERGACTCPDYQYRCAGTEMRCKHGTALAHKLLADGGRIGPEDRVACEGCGEVLPARQVPVSRGSVRLCQYCEPVMDAMAAGDETSPSKNFDWLFDE